MQRTQGVEGLTAHVSCAQAVCRQEFVGKEAARGERVVDEQQHVFAVPQQQALHVPLPRLSPPAEPYHSLQDEDEDLSWPGSQIVEYWGAASGEAC
jgi:hypothetical protein